MVQPTYSVTLFNTKQMSTLTILFRWMILNDSLEEMSSFDDVKLQNYLSTSIMAQRKIFHETEGHPDKELRVIIIVPG